MFNRVKLIQFKVKCEPYIQLKKQVFEAIPHVSSFIRVGLQP